MVDSRIYTRRQIENLIAAGQTIIIFQNNVLRVSDAWKDRHPGGKLVLDHMIGRDATDEIDAWVYTSSPYPQARRSAAAKPTMLTYHLSIACTHRPPYKR
jgi:delta8-fatty-acid desaturase